MAELDTNFVDAVLSANMNGKKRVRLTQIAENEYIVEDITEYEKVGSEYGQKEINTLNETVNGKVNKVEVIDDLDTVKAVTEDNVPVGCKAVTKFANDVNQSLNNLTTIATLWEHPNFSNTSNFQEFAPQTLSIANLSNYDIIGICHSCYDRTRCRFNFIPNILNAQQVLDITWNSNASGYEFRAYQRNFKISGNEIIFYDGYSVRNGTREKNNSFTIPIKIIGIKLK